MPAAGALPKESRAGFTLGLALLTLSLIAALFAIDFFLANLEQSELRSQAAQLYRQGSAFLGQGRSQQAVELLRQSHALQRQNRQYELGLVQALLSARKFDQARALLDDLLRTEPNGGEANLFMARLLVQESNIDDAEAYYHRAIYGGWRENAPARRLQARMELVKLLEVHGDAKALLAELLPLDNEIQNDVASRMQIARLYLLAGSPGRAADVYRGLLLKDRKDSAAYTGLGEAELASGDYYAALSAFVDAYRNHPNDPDARKNIELSSAMTSLDPTPRRLRSAEKFRRASRILRLAQDAMQRCAASRGVASLEDLDQAGELLSADPHGNITNELSEERLSLAEQLWRERVGLCGSAVTARDEPLRLVIEKLSR